MSGKIYNKNLTFLQDQPFAENLLTGFSYKERGKPSTGAASSARESSLPLHSLNSKLLPSLDIQLFGTNQVRNKSEKMRKAETSLIKHFCLILEHTDTLYTREYKQNPGCITKFKENSTIPHLLVSVDSMRNTLLATRTSRSSERVKPPSHFKKILRECRKIRLLYGNLSRRHLSRATSKMRLPGENLLIWLESRLDVVLERAGFFFSVRKARQCVLSGKVLVNSKVVKSPGFLLKGGDLIKVIQRRPLSASRDEQLCRGVLLSSKVFPRLVRNKDLVAAVSKSLPQSNSTLQLKFPPTSFETLKENPYRETVDTGFASSRSSVLDLSPYTLFQDWLQKIKEKRSQSSNNLDHQSTFLLSSESQFKGSAVQNAASLHKKVSSSKNWRFIGSPHLLFSVLFVHVRLEMVISFVAEALYGVDNQKSFQFPIRKRTNTRKSTSTGRGSNSYLVTSYRDDSVLPTISALSNCCAVSTHLTESESRTSKINKGERGAAKQVLEGGLKGTSILEFLVCFIPESLLKNNKSNEVSATREVSQTLVLQKGSINEIHTFFGEGYVRVLTQIYNTILTFPRFSFLCQDDIFSRDLDNTLLINSLVREDKRFLLSVLLSDLLFYSLFIRKELLGVQLKRQQPCSNNKTVPQTSTANTSTREKQKAFDRQMISQLRGGLSNLELSASTSRALIDNPYPLKMDYKKTSLTQGFVLSQVRRTKPLHLEVSYQSLCAVYLYPPQRVCLPLMVDTDCLAKAF